MRSSLLPVLGLLTVICLTGCTTTQTQAPVAADGNNKPASPDWSAELDNIEACSCPAFCQCYFTGQPALHADDGKSMRYCRFNNAFKVAKGHFGDTKLDGLKFWMAGDLGGDFSKGEMDWAVMHFEPSATPEQRKALQAIVSKIFPVKWKSFEVGRDATIEWQRTDDTAMAKLDGGKLAEISMKPARNAKGEPAVIRNAQFWAAPSNDGIYVMNTDVEAYRGGDKPFEYKQSNGFFTTIRISSDDVKKAMADSAVRVQLSSSQGLCGHGCCAQ